jgi:hypothetical protein
LWNGLAVAIQIDEPFLLLRLSSIEIGYCSDKNWSFFVGRIETQEGSMRMKEGPGEGGGG